MTSNRYTPDADQRAANDAAANAAVALVAASYAAELDGKPLTRRQRDLEARAARLAVWLSRQETKRGPR